MRFAFQYLIRWLVALGIDVHEGYTSLKGLRRFLRKREARYLGPQDESYSVDELLAAHRPGLISPELQPITLKPPAG